MDTTAVLRAFRSPDFRDLTRAAIRQGWDTYLRPGGHLDVVNPATGATVQVSLTAHTSGPVLRPKRREFERAGLHLGGHHVTRRAMRQEVPMTDTSDTTQPEADVPAPITERPLIPTPTLGRAGKAGGAFALLGPRVPHQVGDHTAFVGHRADGKVTADVRDPNAARGRRSFQADTEAGVLAKAAASLEARPILPQVVAERVPERAVVQAEARGRNGHDPAHGVTWRAVGVDPDDYPLAAALDRLETALAPAILALEAAGRADVADLVRAEAATPDPVSAELLRLWREVKG